LKRSFTAMVMLLTIMTASIGCAESSDAVTQAGAADDPIVATYEGGTITASELEEKAGPSLAKLRQQIYDAKVQAIEEQIFTRLIEVEAAAVGVSKDEFMKTNVSDKVGEPPAEEIEKVLQQYRPRLPKDDEEARKQVVGFLTGQQQQMHMMELRQRLFGTAGVKILIDPPRVEATMAAHNPSRGPETAPVTMVEYTDFQCPYCSRVQVTVDAVINRYGDHVRHVFKHLPLPMHQQAQIAAEGSLCAADQNEFWKMHDWMFNNRANLAREGQLAEVEAMGLDVALYTACLDEKKYTKAVQDDMAEAQSFGITGTPGFLINGRVLTGAQPLEAFYQVIDDELRRAGVPVPPVPAPKVEAEPVEEGTRPASPDATS